MPQLGGKRAYKGRLGKDRCACQSRRSKRARYRLHRPEAGVYSGTDDHREGPKTSIQRSGAKYSACRLRSHPKSRLNRHCLAAEVGRYEKPPCRSRFAAHLGAMAAFLPCFVRPPETEPKYLCRAGEILAARRKTHETEHTHDDQANSLAAVDRRRNGDGPGRGPRRSGCGVRVQHQPVRRRARGDQRCRTQCSWSATMFMSATETAAIRTEVAARSAPSWNSAGAAKSSHPQR